jgi:hypothetical protein
MVQQTWFHRELPVLAAVVDAFEGDFDSLPDVQDLAQETGLSIDEVAHSLRALDDEYLVLRMTMGDPASWFVEKVYNSARREVGQWPSPENLATALALAMEQVAEGVGDPETKGRLRRAADAIGGLAKDVLVEVGSKVLERQFGLE